MQKLVTFLWYDDNAEEAMNLYTSLFKDSRILSESRGPDGKLFLGNFELNGQEFMALNAGPEFKFTEAISIFVRCEDQAEVDYYWDRLIADGGEESQCGWLKDRFGLSWQIIPNALMELMGDPDPEKAERVRQAMFTMQKIDVAKLEAAHAGV